MAFASGVFLLNDICWRSVHISKWKASSFNAFLKFILWVYHYLTR